MGEPTDEIIRQIVGEYPHKKAPASCDYCKFCGHLHLLSRKNCIEAAEEKGRQGGIKDMEHTQRHSLIIEQQKKIAGLEAKYAAAHKELQRQDKEIADLEIQIAMLKETQIKEVEHIICPTCTERICRHGKKHKKKED
jgi:hypothetical protein